jgi:hypothetical protein
LIFPTQCGAVKQLLQAQGLLHKARVCVEAADPTVQREPDVRLPAQPRATDTDRLRVVNCATITSWRGFTSAEMLRLKQPAHAGVVSADRGPATHCAASRMALHHGCDLMCALEDHTARVNPFPVSTAQHVFLFSLAFAAPPTLISGRSLAFPLVSLPTKLIWTIDPFSGALRPVHDRVSCTVVGPATTCCRHAPFSPRTSQTSQLRP